MARFTPYLFLVEGSRQDTLNRIRTHAYNIMQEFQTNDIAIFLDYLQKIPLDAHMDDWKARTDLISTALAELSLELNIPVFAIPPLDNEGCRLDERPAEAEQEYSEYALPTTHIRRWSGVLEHVVVEALIM